MAIREWSPPPQDTVKINFDAAFQIQDLRSGTGVVARSAIVSVLASRAMLHNNVSSRFEAEALACRATVKMGRDSNHPNIIIEGDALAIIKKMQHTHHRQVTNWSADQKY